MKILRNIALFALVPAVLLSSCSKEYLDRSPTSALDTEMVLNNTDMIPSTVVGTMRMMYSSGFGGKDAVVIGDIMTDIVTSVRGSNGSFKDMEEWNLHQATTDAGSLWAAANQINAASVRTIQAAKRKLSSDSLSMTATQRNNLRSAIAASLVIKVYVEYFLVQYFCVDINVGKNDYAFSNNFQMPGKSKDNKVGIILLEDRALGLTDPANMSTLQATYELMEKEIVEAITYFNASGDKNFTLAAESRFYPTLCAAYLMQARVFLAQHKYQDAYDAAENALNNLPSGANAKLISEAQAMLDAYGENLSSEDIWSLNYTNQDNLSANSLQNLFGSYGFNASNYVISLFKSDDIRKNLYYGSSQRNIPEPNSSSYCWKYPNANGVFNVPIFRVPEIYMIQAEAIAAGGLSGDAKEPLLKVLGARDTTIKGEMDRMVSRYNITDDNLMEVILEENVREFACEGHRWSDLRRNGHRLTRPGSSSARQYAIHFTGYPLSTFSFPVPYSETSTEQWKNGRGIFYDGRKDSRNWQTNAWDDQQGDTYNCSATLPVEGGNYENDPF